MRLDFLTFLDTPMLVDRSHVHIQLGSELWSETASGSNAAAGPGGPSDDGDSEDEDDIEKAIAREVATMKKPKKEKRFGTFLCV